MKPVEEQRNRTSRGSELGEHADSYRMRITGGEDMQDSAADESRRKSMSGAASAEAPC